MWDRDMVLVMGDFGRYLLREFVSMYDIESLGGLCNMAFSVTTFSRFSRQVTTYN